MLIWLQALKVETVRGGEAVRVGRLMVLISAAVVVSGCVQSSNDQLAEGVSSVRTAFDEAAPEPNETAGETELYVPAGYEVEMPSDNRNLLITRGSESFALLMNPNEAPDSTFFYDLQKANPEEAWAVDEKFSQHGRFGFATVRTIADDRFELVVSSGGTKLSTITKESALRSDMNWMMDTVRSVEAAQEE